MQHQNLPSFLQFIDQSLNSLGVTLKEVFEKEIPPYDVAYEKLRNQLETFKFQMLSQMKLHYFNSETLDYNQNETILMFQIKSLLNVKIKR